MIDQYDVLNVANSLEMEINEDIIAEVIYQYNTASPGNGATPDLIVERILYEIMSNG
jgi:hypothetical protein